MARAIDNEAAYRFLSEQLVKETGAFSKGVNKGLNIARSAIRNPDAIPTLTPPNEPLTIEQLREMVGEPVYDYLGQEWYIIQEYYDHELLMTDGTSFEDDDELDRVDERFYRRPPEGEVA